MVLVDNYRQLMELLAASNKPQIKHTTSTKPIKKRPLPLEDTSELVLQAKRKFKLSSITQAFLSHHQIMVNNDECTATSTAAIPIRTTAKNLRRTVVVINQSPVQVVPSGTSTKCAKPHDILIPLIRKAHGIQVQTVSWRCLADKSFFEVCDNPTGGSSSYHAVAVNAVRAKDVESLRQLLLEGDEEGSSALLTKCRSKFGDSLLHMACRWGHLEVVQFLLEQGMPTRLVDDIGRTPLHDACWTSVPQFSIVERLIQEAPELLLVQDHRGHTPLQFIRPEHASQWNSFLHQHQQLLRPTHGAFHCDTAPSSSIS
jgi:hypothetical protein